MGDAENALPPSKKRAAGRELSRDNPGLDDEEDSSEQECGTFKRATDEVLATRRIVKVRRNQTSSTPSSNPFANINLVPSAAPSVTVAAPTTESAASSEKKVSEESKNDAVEEAEKVQAENSKQSESKIDEPVAETVTSSEPAKGQDESCKQSDSKDEPAVTSDPEKGEDESSTPSDSKNASGVTSDPEKGEAEAAADKGSSDNKENSAAVDEPAKLEVDDGKMTGVEKTENENEKDTSHENVDSSRLRSFGQLSSSQNAFTGLAGTGFSTSSFSFGAKDGSTLSSSHGSVFGQINNGNSSLFSAPGASIVSQREGTGFPSMQEVVVETGEENEKVVFSADSALFEFFDGSWKERGKGELKVNVSIAVTGRARLLMRARGNYRLILNASLYPDMKLTNMEKKGITFACLNSAGEGKDGLSTFALKFKDASIVEEFRAAVMAHKGNTTADMKTPENSPNATDD